MPKSITSSKTVLLFILGFFVFATGTMLARRNTATGSKPAEIVADQGIQPARDGSAQLVRVFVHGEDIYPAVVYARPGKVLIRAENETQSNIAIVIERVTPGQSRQAVGRVNTVRKSKRADQEFSIGTGEYVFYEESQPDFKGILIVAPK